MHVARAPAAGAIARRRARRDPVTSEASASLQRQRRFDDYYFRSNRGTIAESRYIIFMILYPVLAARPGAPVTPRDPCAPHP
jgi:hypothetical protein